jgi:20S proteasome subunit alpha 5
MFQYKAKAIGSAAEGAQTMLEEKYHSGLTLQTGVRLALGVLKEVMEDKISAINVQVSVVSLATKQFTTLSTQEVQTELGLL